MTRISFVRVIPDGRRWATADPGSTFYPHTTIAHDERGVTMYVLVVSNVLWKEFPRCRVWSFEYRTSGSDTFLYGEPPSEFLLPRAARHGIENACETNAHSFLGSS